MDAKKLYEVLRAVQESKGYHFNKDRSRTLELLDGLLKNKERYGYMVCPCRLAAGARDKDADIICPCAYREADVAEYGTCYCSLYVSDDWNAGRIEHRYVPERRPPERMAF
jgi:ferredoxin-thioredoxin reductase catalytic subunit